MPRRKPARPRPIRLAGLPVVCCSLHSQLAPVCAALGRELAVAYVQLPGGALPVPLSDTVRVLRERGYLKATAAVGPCFGGDLACVSAASALLACLRAGADAVVCGIGPGVVGTGSRYGHGGLAAADAANAAEALGGAPVIAPRVSLADARERHRGLSHHTVAALDLIPGPVPVAWPAGAGCSFRRRGPGGGRRLGLAGRVRGASALAHGTRTRRRPLVLRRCVRRRGDRAHPSGLTPLSFARRSENSVQMRPSWPGASVIVGPPHADRRRQGDQAGRVSGRAHACRRGRAEAARPRGRRRGGRRGRQRVPRLGLRERRRADRVRRGGLGDGGHGVEGEGAAPGGVRAAARGPRPLHLPASRGRRRADARPDRERLDLHRLRDRGDRRRTASPAGADERGRGPTGHADGRLGAREGSGRPGAAARRRARRAARQGGRPRRRDRRLQRGADRRGDAGGRLDHGQVGRAHARPRDDARRAHHPVHVEPAPDRAGGGRRRPDHRRRADPGGARARSSSRATCSPA